MPAYLLNEGRLDLPAAYTDNSTNVLILHDADGHTINVTISRDRLLTGEELAAYVDRQIGLLKKQIKGYKLIERSECQIGQADAPLAAQQLRATLPGQHKTTLHQQQAGTVLPAGEFAGKVLVFTVTTTRPLNEAEQTLWKDLLASYRPHG